MMKFFTFTLPVTMYHYVFNSCFCNEYIEKGFPIGYDNKEFGTSEMFTKLKGNIIRFFKDILPE
jgi:hypothetical protein